MVRTWNLDPSKDLNRNGKLFFLLPTAPAVQFPKLKRFIDDGQSHVENFLNDNATLAEGADVLYDARSVPRLSDVVAGRKVSPCKTNASKFASSRAYLSKDPRFLHVSEPYAKALGPGEYPGAEDHIGVSSSNSPTRTSYPARDPERASAAFISPSRSPLFEDQFYRSPDRVYIEPAQEYKIRVNATFPSTKKASDVASWRNAGRMHDGWQSLPDIRYDPKVDASGKPISIQSQSHDPSHSPGFWLQSKQARLIALPKERTPDSRLSHAISYDKLYDMSKLGPGSYGPMISEGSKKKKSYRLFGSDSPPPSPQLKPRGEQSATFTSIDRTKKYGPHNRFTDSTLVSS